MLRQELRLKNKKDFDGVYKEGRRLNSRFFLMKIKKNHKDINRIGFVVSKKSVSKIVLRNKLKRRMREIVGLFSEEIKQGYDIILIAKPGAYLKNYSEIKVDLGDLFKNGQLLIK